jgi:hypothetical protein
VVNVRRRERASSHRHLPLFDDPHPLVRIADHAVPLSFRHDAATELEPIG